MSAAGTPEPTVAVTKRQAAALAAWADFGLYIAKEFWGPDLPLCRQLAPWDQALDRADLEPLGFTSEEIEGP
jgi:hypothetical protein